ncbi:aromatic ring-hydroxylating oxygenase subunit alpha [Primorskyibacter marinus]|uniref:aromatic ring-hydroxylating oxygenase subunit alpha n=1 Tax=Primorskyibacter marinus TaxID=1977320 RepID=UPI000E305371|nr:aromatic ring-hydroxylating dioxygenase subunit alpha [Primorskyibacter marinus]
MTELKCTDPVILNQWHPLSSIDEITPGLIHSTMLLEENISYGMDTDGNAYAWPFDNQLPTRSRLTSKTVRNPLPIHIAHGYVWTSLGEPPETLFSFEEYYEADRINVPTGVFGVNVSAGRAVENFLDMSHFPYVHTGILGEEPHTEVKEYAVEVSETRDEVLATQCQFYQPKAALASEGGAMVDYTYRVPHVNCALLYKSSPNDASRSDVIYMFLQPMSQDWVRAHTGMCVIDEDNTYESIRYFQQVIFGQDKPILENQYPKRLPLDPRSETPIRADKTAIAFRRWLSRKGLRYGVIPAAA